LLYKHVTIIFAIIHRKNDLSQLTYTLIRTKMGKVIIVDTETTGLPKVRNQQALVGPGCWPDIVSISWSVFKNGKKESQKTFIIKPDGWAIPIDSIRIHGITNERALAEGVPLVNAMQIFQEDLKNTDHVIAHNLQFDKNVIFNAYKWRLNMDPLALWPGSVDICSMKLSELELKLPARGYSPTGYKSPSLAELWKDTFQCEPPANAHAADRDVEVLEKICLTRWKRIFGL